MKFRSGVLIAVLFFACAFALRAQTGCDDSPEDPTIVLALLASAGVLFSAIRGRVRARHGSSAR
jgi:XrtJ-associated TM-motif-TM protein